MKAGIICCQIGAREHYALARGLQQKGELRRLITDAWVPPDSAAGRSLGRLFQPLRERYHPELPTSSVTAYTKRMLVFEFSARIRGLTGWERMIARNDWFQEQAVQFIRNHRLFEGGGEECPVVFSYSYAARSIFAEARRRGCTTVLGQIDAGPYEEKLVQDQHHTFPEFHSETPGAPEAYWKRWREETEIADAIVVNSEWSKNAVQRAGVPEQKLHVVPLIYETPLKRRTPRAYPKAFSKRRPLRVLFLGTLTLRKGLAQLLQAAHALQSEPIEWWMVGDGPVTIPNRYREQSSIQWVGRVPRGRTRHYYEKADVFLLPTISDGFALTQLEAQAHGLPVIASRRCGNVVIAEKNGLLLPDVTHEAISSAVTWCSQHPEHLESMSRSALARVDDFRAEQVIPAFLEAAEGAHKAS